jgi:hypothetical protein
MNNSAQILICQPYYASLASSRQGVKISYHADEMVALRRLGLLVGDRQVGLSFCRSDRQSVGFIMKGECEAGYDSSGECRVGRGGERVVMWRHRPGA